jgi:hypothetical protein
MPQMSLGQARIIDPILTTMAIGIKIPGYVGHMAFPPIFAIKRTTKIISFGTKEEKFLYPTRRAPGSNTMRISTGYGDTSVTLYQDAIEAELPVEVQEEAEGVVDMQMRSSYLVKQRLCHRLEFDQLSLLGNTAGYPVTNRVLLTGASQFSDPTSNIEAAFDLAKQAIVQGIGMPPNTIIFGGYRAYNAVKRHPRVRDQFHRSESTTITAAMIASAFDIPSWGLSLATWIDPINPLVETPMFDNKIWIGYVPGQGDVPLVSGMNPSINANRATPSFGYTYLLSKAQAGGMDTGLIMEPPYYGNNEATWYFRGSADRLPAVTGLAAGYLFDNVSA